MKNQLKSYIIHENEEWLIPLRKALKKFDVQYEEWLLNDMIKKLLIKLHQMVFFFLV